jgi:hypothetical protein
MAAPPSRKEGLGIEASFGRLARLITIWRVGVITIWRVGVITILDVRQHKDALRKANGSHRPKTGAPTGPSPPERKRRLPVARTQLTLECGPLDRLAGQGAPTEATCFRRAAVVRARPSPVVPCAGRVEVPSKASSDSALRHLVQHFGPRPARPAALPRWNERVRLEGAPRHRAAEGARSAHRPAQRWNRSGHCSRSAGFTGQPPSGAVVSCMSTQTAVSASKVAVRRCRRSLTDAGVPARNASPAEVLARQHEQTQRRLCCDRRSSSVSSSRAISPTKSPSQRLATRLPLLVTVGVPFEYHEELVTRSDPPAEHLAGRHLEVFGYPREQDQ